MLEWVWTYDAAVEKIVRKEHDVYLLDYRLGDHNGLELLQEMLSGGCKAPMILLTGQGDHEVDVEAMKLGAADYLIKGQINGSLLGRSIRYAIEHSQTLEALRESEERYQRLVELSPDAIFVHAEGEIVFINKAGVKLFGGSTAAQMIGMPVMNFVHDDCKEIIRDRIHQMTEEAVNVSFIEQSFLRIDRTVVDVELAVIPFMYMDKPAPQVVARDISERKRAEQKLS